MPAAGIDGSFIRPRTNLEVGLEPTEGFDQGTHQHLLISHNHQPIKGTIMDGGRINYAAGKSPQSRSSARASGSGTHVEMPRLCNKSKVSC